MKIPRTPSLVVSLLVAAFLFPILAEAHILPGDPQTLEDQLQGCDLDLFRTQRSDGTYYAAHGNRALANHYYPLLFRQAFRKRNPFGPRHDEDLARRLAPQMIGITLNLAYADALPSRSRRSARLRALMMTLVTEVEPHVLSAVVGPFTGRARRVQRRSGYPPELLGAAVLSHTIADLYDKVAWGPSFVVDHRMPQAFDSSGWSLDSAPLPDVQFDLLVQEAETHIQGLDAKAKTSLVGGVCLHTHPSDSAGVVGKAQFWDWLRRLFGGGGEGNGSSGGGGDDEPVNDPNDPFEGAIDVVDQLPQDPKPDKDPDWEPASQLPPLDDPSGGELAGPDGGDPGGGDGVGHGGSPGGGGTQDPSDDCGTLFAHRLWWHLSPETNDVCAATNTLGCARRFNSCVANLRTCESLRGNLRSACETVFYPLAMNCIGDALSGDPTCKPR